MVSDSSDELDLAASLGDLALSFFADIASLDDNWDLRYPASTKELGISELEEVDDRSGILGLFLNVSFAHLFGDESPQLAQS
jgi:hypothetical protein